VTYILIARQRLGKHIPATNALNNRTSIARQRSCKYGSLTTEDGVFRGVRAEGLYKDKEGRLSRDRVDE
jgi:hypothetical protein